MSSHPDSTQVKVISAESYLSSLDRPDDNQSTADTPDVIEHYKALLSATVMLVDDEPTTLEILQTFLEEAGYQHFVTTSDSTRAMELLVANMPDVVLLDVNMPKVTGFDILSAMRANPRLKHIPVLVLTSSDGASTKLRALQLGASDFLAKPVDPSELALRLRNTLAAKAYQDRLTYYDILTSLPNRRMFMERVDWALKNAERVGKSGAILHIDLDRFKKINDTLGHSVGDALLKAVAERLTDCVRSVDTIGRLGKDGSRISLSRLGGDEFTVLLPEILRCEDAAMVARRILAGMSEVFILTGQELFVTPSIGIATFPDDGEDADSLIKHAEVAMYHCKHRGRNTYEYYSTEMNIRSLEQLKLEQHMRKALQLDELELYYQPKVNVSTGQIIGTEALLRWNHPELGMIPPLKFIPMAEETGLIVPIGAWVLQTACRQNKAWQDAGFGDMHVAVNVSIRQFHEPGFLDTVKEALQLSGLAPHYLTLELTENMIMENASENVHTLHKIKEMDINLSVDDFGTGYSSLSYLTQFPLDELKIDKSFVSGIQHEDDTAPIVSAIIAMAHSLGLKVVAEGVETEPQLAFIRNKHCNEYQGFLFSEPLCVGSLTTLCRSRIAARER